MNLEGRMKVEYCGFEANDFPRPMESLHCIGPPPFLSKTYEMVEDSSTNHLISWSGGNNSFIIWDPDTFSISLLPRYFKHNNFSSFVRQLNTYGFRKVDPDRWEFANQGFLRGQKHLLKTIRRRRGFQQQASQQALESCFGMEGEVERLKMEKQTLIAELLNLRQQQQNTKASLKVMEQILTKTEAKQQHMLNFLARVMLNPSFVKQFTQRKELEEAVNKKRRKVIEQETRNIAVTEYEPFIKTDLHKLCGISNLEESELSELLALSADDLHNFDVLLNKTAENDTVFQGFWEGLVDDDKEIDGLDSIVHHFGSTSYV